jgi:hypothetical protein
MDDAEQPITLPTISVAQLRMLEGTRALTDAELVRALIQFANTGSYAARLLVESGAGAPLPESMPARPGEAPVPVDIHHRAELCDALGMIVAGKVSASLGALWRRRAAGLVLLRVFVPGGEHRYRWQPFEWWQTWPQSASIANALLLLLEKPFRGQLCRCGLAECGRFFFAARPPKLDRDGHARGAPVRDYCPGTDHRDRARTIAARERMAKLRADRAKAKQSKRRRS